MILQNGEYYGYFSRLMEPVINVFCLGIIFKKRKNMKKIGIILGLFSQNRISTYDLFETRR